MKTATSKLLPGVGEPRAEAIAVHPMLVCGSSAAVMLVFGGLFATWQLESVPGGVFLAAMTLFGLCGLPFAIWFMVDRRRAPMFELICVAFAVAYAMPVFLYENGIHNFNSYTQLDWAETGLAVQLTIGGVGAMIAGYYLLPRSALGHWLPRADLPMDTKRMNRYLWVAFGVAGGLRVVERASAASWGRGITGALSAIITMVLGVGIALLAHRVFRPESRANFGERLLLYVAGIGAAVVGMGAGMLEEGFVPLVVIFIARWHASRRLPVVWLLIGGLSLLLLNAAKYEYRNEVWYASRTYTIPETVEIWVDKCAAVVKSLDTADGVKIVLSRTIYRFDLIHPTALVVKMTPQQLPHYGGDSYGYLFYGWIPRLLWPDKPTAQQANDMFAVDYGLLLDSQVGTTMMGIGFLAEAYANFGLAGVVLVMFLIGCYFGGANVVFNHPASEGGRAAFIVVLTYYFNGLGSATTMFVFFGLQGFIALPLILWFFARRWRAQPTDSAVASPARTEWAAAPGVR